GCYIVQYLFLGNFKKNRSKKKSNKQLLGTNMTIYGVWSPSFFFLTCRFLHVSIYTGSDWLAPVLSVMHERQFDWLTHALPHEKLNILQLLLQKKHETHRTGTQRSHNSVRQRMTSPHSNIVDVVLLLLFSWVLQYFLHHCLTSTRAASCLSFKLMGPDLSLCASL